MNLTDMNSPSVTIVRNKQRTRIVRCLIDDGKTGQTVDLPITNVEYQQAGAGDPGTVKISVNGTRVQFVEATT